MIDALTELLKHPGNLTGGIILLLDVIGFITETIVPGSTYRALKKRHDALQTASDTFLDQYRRREEEERLWREAKQHVESRP